ncbi:hypothetical protein GGQ84_002687 [Desulfitispora alkaliphila]|uniref:hypothetical protein n=1 Tax=Desulfitispora alkaliphila TaxID=622674 RepID=UPI003D254D90
MNSEKITINVPAELLDSISNISSNTLKGNPTEIIMQCIKYTAHNASYLDKQPASTSYEDVVANLDFDQV